MHHWIATPEALGQLAERLAEAPAIGLDTEFMRVRTYWPELALLQVCVGGEVWLVDPLACGPLPVLAPLLARTTVGKLMHSASEDVIALLPAATLGLHGLFDTQIAASFAGFGPGIGYQRLVAEQLGVALEKTETRSNWLARPLSAQQLHYAEADVLHLDALFDLLRTRLQQRGMLEWCAEDCARMARGVLAPANPHWEFKSLWRWPLERQARLRRLLDWREQAAQRIDRPRLWLFDNPTAASLVEDPPAQPSALAARLAGQRGFPKRETGALHELLHAPLTDADLLILPIPEPLRGEAEQRFEALRQRVAERAASLDLPPALLAPRRVLEILARDPAAAELGIWRSAVLAEDLAALGIGALPESA
jgi:ribonuclease D